MGFWVGDCEGYGGGADAYTGYKSVSRTFVEEVPTPQDWISIQNSYSLQSAYRGKKCSIGSC